MSLLEKINSNLKESSLKKEKDKIATLRLVVAALKDKQIEKRTSADKNLKDEDVVTVLNKMVKQRKESLEIFKKASRSDLSEKEEKEIQIIQSFLPKQLDDAETKKVCEEAIKSSNALSIKDMGKVMGILKAKYASTLDFAKAGVILKSLLNK